MYKVLNILIFFIVSAFCQENKSKPVEPFYTNDYLNSDNPEITFSRIDSFKIDLNKNKKDDLIILNKPDNWNDPGDFHQIVIIFDNGQKFTFTNFDGWVAFGNNYPVPETIQQQNLLQSNKVLLSTINQSKYLLLFGWVYANEPGTVTVINLDENIPEVVFNTNFEIQSLKTNGFSGIHHLKKCTVIFKNKKPILHYK